MIPTYDIMSPNDVEAGVTTWDDAQPGYVLLFT
jgi:hypothetical protein